MSSLLIAVPNSLAQDLRLEISVPKSKISAQESLNLTLRLTNNSSRSYYVSSAIRLGAVGIGHQFGSYQLQLRKSGASEFIAGPGMASDGIPPRNLRAADFILHNQLVLLQEGMFIGKTFGSNWYGFTLLEPGRYSIRVTYSSSGAEKLIPSELRFPIFRSPLISNVIDLEIQP
ncbi:MAG: hypothetical protein HY646_14840 [Acidobacteria bacterium]|nr:hypothetical protein [Acidobacteriota bacterium]